jgi:DNA-binding NarL/FixJ family response regulator
VIGQTELVEHPTRPKDGATAKGLVVVTDNPMMAGAIRAGLHEGRTFELLGYLDPRRLTAAKIRESAAAVVLVDEGERPDRAIDLIGAVKEAGEEITVVLLAMQMDGECLERAFDAGANSVISKAIHPGALATVLDAALSGNIVHSPARVDPAPRAPSVPATEHLSLTPREIGILQLVAAGATNSEIAAQLWITRQTVKFHLSNIYRKLGVSNRTGACHYAHLNGMMAAPAAGAAAALAS